jgi:hypothetical protein
MCKKNLTYGTVRMRFSANKLRNMRMYFVQRAYLCRSENASFEAGKFCSVCLNHLVHECMFKKEFTICSLYYAVLV